MRRNDRQASATDGGFRGLIVLNGALLLVLMAVTYGAGAEAQSRVPGNYTMVGGGVNGSASSAVYIADATNRRLVGVTYNPGTNELVPIGARNLGQDAMQARGAGRSR